MNGSSKPAPKIMLVDDEKFFRGLLRDILEQEGFTVVAEGVDGNEALDKYRQFCPDVVIMDIFMPGKDGISATKEILSFDSTARVVICSAVGFDDEIAIAMQAGARASISKPFMADEITETINRVMA